MAREAGLILNSVCKRLATGRAAWGRGTGGSVTQIEGRERVRVGWVSGGRVQCDQISLGLSKPIALLLRCTLHLTRHAAKRNFQCYGDYLPEPI